MRISSHLTRNWYDEKGIRGKRFSEIAFTESLLCTYKVVAAGGDRKRCLVMCVNDGTIFLFEFTASTLERDGDERSLSIFYANPRIYTIRPDFDEESKRLVFRLRSPADHVAVDPDDPAFSNPPETERYPPLSEPDSARTDGARFFVMRRHAVVATEWETSPMGSDTNKETRRIVIAGQLKDYFVVLTNGNGYALYGIPETFIKSILYQVIQIEHVLRWKKEQGFFFPDIRRAKVN